MARTKAVFAQLLDRFHLTPWDVMRLTDRQIADFYFHPRDKDGAIKEPKSARIEKQSGDVAPPTYEQSLEAINTLANVYHLTPENVAQLKADLAKKHERKKERTGGRATP